MASRRAGSVKDELRHDLHVLGELRLLRRRFVDALLALPGHEFFLDASMGVALHPAHGRDAEAEFLDGHIPGAIRLAAGPGCAEIRP